MSRIAISLLVGSTLLVTACGSDDESTDSPAPSESAAPTTAPVATEVPTTPAPETTAPTTHAPETSTAPTTEPPESSTAPTTAPSTTAPAGDSIATVSTANGATFIPGYTEFAPGYAAAIDGAGPITALMPDDEAFIGFTTTHPELTEALRSDFALLDTVLTYHVLESAMTVADIAAASELITVQGEPITVEVVGDTVVFNGGEGSVKIADLAASNGIVHILDGILLPPSIAADAV